MDKDWMMLVSQCRAMCRGRADHKSLSCGPIPRNGCRGGGRGDWSQWDEGEGIRVVITL